MGINSYDRYDLIRVTVNIATTTGAVTPAPLIGHWWNVEASSSTTTTLTTGGGGGLNQTGSTGDWFFDIFADDTGDYRWELISSAGNYPGAARGQFRVIDDVFE